MPAPPDADIRKVDAMARLSYPSPTEVQLRLGPHEDAILTVVRHWAWWTRAEVEGQVPGEPGVSAVILTAERTTEPTLREIIQRSFQIVFPAGGGEGELITAGSGARAQRRMR